MTFDLVSPLPLHECVRRLRAATDGGWAMAGQKSVLGAVGDNSIRLRRRSYYRHSAQCWLSGKFVEADGQTWLHCTIGLHPIVRVVLEYWVACVLLGGGAVFVRSLHMSLHLARAGHEPLPDILWPGILGPPLLVAFGAVLLAIGDRPSGDEPRFLVEFVARTIDAKETWPKEARGRRGRQS
jgi:hypothetical protein